MTSETFWSHVDCTGGPDACWPWTGRRTDGYGAVGSGPQFDRAHRVAFRLSGGIIPPGQLVRHLCHNPLCCNPAHLAAGTHADNMHDMAVAGRRRSRVLTSAQRTQAISWYGRGLATAPEIARLLDVTPQRIRHLFHGA
jgi:hypothetical protein